MLYRSFSSLKTSVYILGLMCLFFLAGTIFPQGEKMEDYMNAGGKFVLLVSTFDLLDIFGSPLFFILTFILILNLAICIYDRFASFMKSKRKFTEFEVLKKHPNVLTFDRLDFEKRLMNAGLSMKANTRDAVNPDVNVYEKGIQYWWLSWFYHVGIILAIIGFFITALFAFEKDVLLYPGQPERISLQSSDTGWNRLLEKAGISSDSETGDGGEYILTLEEFNTEYYQGLKIDYPKDKMERLALGIGLKKLAPSSEGFSYMPKKWLTRLKVEKPDRDSEYAEMWVNKPFRTGLLTLYQMGYEQKVHLKVNGSLFEAEARMPFSVENMRGSFALETLKVGSLLKRDGTVEEIVPETALFYLPEWNPYMREFLGVLKKGERLFAKGVNFEFVDYREGSYLSYRKDPGVWLVGIACLFVFLGLFVRSFGAWYRIQFAVENKMVYALVSTRGILADRDRIIKRISEQKP